LAVGCARLGQPDQRIVAGTLAELAEVEFGAPLHCLVICGELHPCEEELLKFFRAKEDDKRVAPPPGKEGEGSESGSEGEEESDGGGQ
jgi:hypothetical protein